MSDSLDANIVRSRELEERLIILSIQFKAVSNSKVWILKNLHLLVSLTIVVPFSLVYGLSPANTLPQYFDFTVETTDLKNVFRAIMGLYLAISIIWILGIFKPNFWKMATIFQVIFMLGLAFGRALSMLTDGIPSQAFITGFLLELILGTFGLIQLKRMK